MSSWKVWFHSLIRAVIGGGANSVIGVVSAGWVLPDKVNTGTGLHTALTLMGVQFVIGAVISVAMFLQKSPVPEGWDGTDRRTDGK